MFFVLGPVLLFLLLLLIIIIVVIIGNKLSVLISQQSTMFGNFYVNFFKYNFGNYYILYIGLLSVT